MYKEYTFFGKVTIDGRVANFIDFHHYFTHYE